MTGCTPAGTSRPVTTRRTTPRAERDPAATDGPDRERGRRRSSRARFIDATNPPASNHSYVPDAVAAAERTLARLRGIDAVRARAATVVVTELHRTSRRLGQRQRDLLDVQSVVHLPWDPALDLGGELDVDRFRRGTRTAFLELAAAVSADLVE